MRIVWLFVIFLIVQLGASAQQAAPSWLEIAGDVSRPRTFQEQDWKQLKHTSISATNAHEKKTSTYSGVWLRDLLQAHFGGGFHHPHLRGTTVHDWPLNVFSDEDAAAQLSILRAIASSDLHNLVYRADYRIVPAVTMNSSRMPGKLEAKRPSTKRG